MDNASMTALVSTFARWYHAQYSGVKIFDDTKAELFLTADERATIASNMGRGITFFNQQFSGTEDEALRWIVDNRLSPSPLGRAAFAEWYLQNAVRLGAKQYLILGAGYDSFAYRQPAWTEKLQIFEIDHPVTAQDKRKRLEAAGVPIPANVHFINADFNDAGWTRALLSDPAFSRQDRTFCSLLGLSYYLREERFAQLIAALADVLASKSSLAFDYPDQAVDTGNAGTGAKQQAMLAAAAGEPMQTGYSYDGMERLLEQRDFLIYAHQTPPEITAQWFAAYNQVNPAHTIAALDNVNYCLAVKS